ncbi:sorting nexin-19-like [Tropilaelaps mercedesae]|uniref:Sorting nexin-19-like n=1 Tax=Tropilaelaps mercedesae TaxID=418985 RepID=A0A1V9X951_9ACAR|nr:sorting nexin-19-like [Tropilaelaps mercedesae]
MPEVLHTVQFQLFMGVHGDPDNYFAGGVATSGNSLRIDRMLADGVRGALDLIKTALPGDISPNREVSNEYYLLEGSYRGDTWEQQRCQPQQRNAPLTSCVKLKYDNDANARHLRQAILNYIDSFDLTSSPEFSPVHCGGVSPMTPVQPTVSSGPELDEERYFMDTFPKPAAPVGTSQPLSPGRLQQLSDQLQLRLAFNQGRQTSSFVSGAASSGIFRTISPTTPPLPCNPLVQALLDLITIILEGSGHGTSKLSALLSRLENLMGSFAEEWLSDKVEEAFSSHNCATMLHKLHLVISGLAQGGNISPTERSQEEARQALRLLMPSWAFTYIPVLDHFIDTVLESLSQERFNRALVYKLVDALLDLLASIDSIEEWTSTHR